MNSQRSKRICIFVVSLVCFSIGYYFWSPVTVEAQGRSGDSNGVPGQISDLETRVENLEDDNSFLLQAVADLEDRVGSLQAALELCCGGSGDGGSGGDDGGDAECPGGTITVYLDQDADGHGVASRALEVCREDGIPPGYALSGDDCDDSDSTIYPGAPELRDHKDNDCDGAIDEGL